MYSHWGLASRQVDHPYSYPAYVADSTKFWYDMIPSSRVETVNDYKDSRRPLRHVNSNETCHSLDNTKFSLKPLFNRQYLAKNLQNKMPE